MKKLPLSGFPTNVQEKNGNLEIFYLIVRSRTLFFHLGQFPGLESKWEWILKHLALSLLYCLAFLSTVFLALLISHCQFPSI